MKPLRTGSTYVGVYCFALLRISTELYLLETLYNSMLQYIYQKDMQTFPAVHLMMGGHTHSFNFDLSPHQNKNLTVDVRHSETNYIA